MSSKQSFSQRFPPYVPVSFRGYTLLRKLVRQAKLRQSEQTALKKGCPQVTEDGQGFFADSDGKVIPHPAGHINKCALWMDEDLGRADIKEIQEKLHQLKEKLREKNLMFCSAAGTFVKNTYVSWPEKKKLWEDTWVLRHADLKAGMKVLDIGGASTPFSFYLASVGCSVNVIDNDWGNCGIVYNVNYVAKKMNWDIQALDWDIEKGLPFKDGAFDRVFSVCVIEHLTSDTRRKLMKEIARVLKPDGIAGLTTDYDHGRKVAVTDKGLRFGFREKFQHDVIKPSGLTLMGNSELVDGKVNENFLGAFFLKKT